MSERLYEAITALDTLTAEVSFIIDAAVAEMADAWPDDEDVRKAHELFWTGHGEIGSKPVRDRLARSIVHLLASTQDVQFDVIPKQARADLDHPAQTTPAGGQR